MSTWQASRDSCSRFGSLSKWGPLGTPKGYLGMTAGIWGPFAGFYMNCLEKLPFVGFASLKAPDLEAAQVMGAEGPFCPCIEMLLRGVWYLFVCANLKNSVLVSVSDVLGWEERCSPVAPNLAYVWYQEQNCRSLFQRFKKIQDSFHTEGAVLIFPRSSPSFPKSET